MKKLIFAALALLSATASYAQPVNRTYSLPAGYRLGGWYNHNAWIDPAMGGGDYFTAEVLTAGSTVYDSLMVVKLDAAYNPQTQVMFPGASHLHKLISTADTGLLLAYYGTINLNQAGIVLVKLDVNLNTVWSFGLPVVSWPFMVSNVDIEAVTDAATGQQNYYVLYSGTNSGNNFSVARVAANGAVIWQNEYSDNSGTADAPHALTSYPDPNTGDLRVVMAGSRGTAFGTTELFGMTIDDAGSIVTPYTAISTLGGELEWPDIVYDGQDLVMTYVQENSGTPVPGATTNASFIGIVKTDLSFNPIYATVHWITCENYGLGISVVPPAAGATTPDYIVSGWTAHCVSTQGTVSSPVIMKINGSTGNPVWTNIYNPGRRSIVQVGRHVLDPSYNIHMAYTVAYTPDESTRLLVTTPSGSACGEEKPTVWSRDISASTSTYTYLGNPTMPPMGIVPNPLFLQVAPPTECDPVQSNSWNYRLMQPSVIPEVSITPTLLHHASERVSCSVTTEAAATASISITNLLGQRIYTGTQQLSKGTNSFALPAVFNSGLNIVQVNIGDKPVLTEKVSLVE